MTSESRAPSLLVLLAAVYLFSFMSAASSYGDPFPLMGTFYSGRGGEALVVADAVVSLYLVIGILKRQRLTLWLLIAYNLFDIVNALVNLAVIPMGEYLRVSGATLSQAELRLNTLVPAFFLIILNLSLIANRRRFNNTSPYLF